MATANEDEGAGTEGRADHGGGSSGLFVGAAVGIGGMITRPFKSDPVAKTRGEGQGGSGEARRGDGGPEGGALRPPPSCAPRM